MTAKSIAIEQVCARWRSADRPLFRGSLITPPGEPVCYCAQGDVLHLAGWSDDNLRGIGQTSADRAVAKVLGISTAHAILLRLLNDAIDGCPQDVLENPEKILGDQAPLMLTFWKQHLDRMTADDWRKAGAAAWPAAGSKEWAAARNAAGAAAEDAVGPARRAVAYDAAGAAAEAAAWDAAGAAAEAAARAAAWATLEIQGRHKLKTQFYFLPLFDLEIVNNDVLSPIAS